MCNCTRHFRVARIYKSLLRTLMLIIFGLANINNGLSSYPHKESGSTITSSNSFTGANNLNTNNHNGNNNHEIKNIGDGSNSGSGSSSISRNQDIHLNQNLINSHQTNTGIRNILPNLRQLTKENTMINNNNSYSHSINDNLIIDTNTEDGIRDRETSAAIFDGDDIYKTPMYFGTENQTVVTTQIGATAHIPCTIHHIGDGVVSWIRKKDYHLLTVGLTTYSSDERFSAAHLKHSEDWTLQIKFVQLRDAGVYECQVSTHPPTSIFLHLNVVEARAEISGPPILYLTPGSQLRLQCRVVQNTEASEYIFWYHDNRMINYDIDRGINVSTETDFQSSELTILKTRREHSGNFTCVASNTQPASVLVHIFKADNPAAMYHGHVGASTKSYQSQLHNIMLIISIGYSIYFTCVHSNFV